MNKFQLFIRSTLEKDYEEKASFLGYTLEEMIDQQFRRLIMTFFYTAIAVFMATQKLWTAAIFFFILSFIMYKSRYRRILSEYKNARYNQQISFSMFSRLIDTYLDSTQSLYVVFTKILGRLTTKESKRSLTKLMSRMQDNNEDQEAFREFSNEMSATNSSMNFMMTLYYSQFAPKDKTVIKELSQMAVKEVFDSIKEIVEIKSNRVEKCGILFLVVSFLVLVCIVMAMTISVFKTMTGSIGGS